MEWGHVNVGDAHVSTVATPIADIDIEYPESDGLPIADNTKQFRCITTIKDGLDAVFEDVPDVFVAGDLLWYPVKGNNKIRTAPDIMVVFGRPKGDRGSYIQHREGNVAPKVTFEILSPGNRAGKMIEKFLFYERHGVEEYYVFDPDDGALDGWRRQDDRLVKIDDMESWRSPLLGVRFQVVDGELRMYDRAGVEILTYAELVKARKEEQLEKERAKLRAEKLAAQLKALGVEPEA